MAQAPRRSTGERASQRARAEGVAGGEGRGPRGRAWGGVGRGRRAGGSGGWRWVELPLEAAPAWPRGPPRPIAPEPSGPVEPARSRLLGEGGQGAGTRQAAAGAVSLSLSRARRRARRRTEERRRPPGRYRAGAARPRAKFAPAAAASQTPAAPGAGARAARGRGGRAGLRLCARSGAAQPARGNLSCPAVPARVVAPAPGPSTC